MTQATSGSERYEDINAFERYLTRNGTSIRKFFLHVSKEEQRKRFLERLDEPGQELEVLRRRRRSEREHWDDYMDAYEDMIRHDRHPARPWYVVPADHKWFTRLVVAAAIVDTLAGARPRVPRRGSSEAEGAGEGPGGAPQVLRKAATTRASPPAARDAAHGRRPSPPRGASGSRRANSSA